MWTSADTKIGGTCTSLHGENKKHSHAIPQKFKVIHNSKMKVTFATTQIADRQSSTRKMFFFTRRHRYSIKIKTVN